MTVTADDYRSPAVMTADPRWTGLTLGGLVLRALRRHPDRTAFSSDVGVLTYAGTLDLIGRYQRALAERGLRHGDRVALLGGNDAEAWCAGVAVQLSGMVSSSMHPMGSLADQLYQIADLDAAACVVSARTPPERGGSIHLQAGFEPGRTLENLARERITMTLAVPTMIYMLLDHPDLDRTDLSALELLIYGASTMSPARLAEGLDRIGPVFSQMYGQTECSPISLLRRADHADPSLAGSCGVPVGTVDVALLDLYGDPVEPGEAGEVCVRGPSAMEGYWKKPDLTEQAFRNGRLRTGDIATQDDRGYLRILDRTKDMIISGGYNVYPSEVEAALTAHDAVAMAAVFGLPDDKWGESVSAAVVLRPGAVASVEELIDHVRDLKGAVQAPKSLRLVDALPMTAVGKIDKKVLR